MHEHGVIDRILSRASDEAARCGGTLRVVRVRLGALAASSPERLRADFAHALTHLGDPPIALEIEEAPEHPAGIELVSLEIAKARAPL